MLFNLFQSNNLMVSEVESLARERPGKSLPKEIERTKKLGKMLKVYISSMSSTDVGPC
jgi:hypothetical protein